MIIKWYLKTVVKCCATALEENDMAEVIPEASNNFSHISWGSFQQRFHERDLILWLNENQHISLYFCVLISIFLVILKKYMENRPPFDVTIIVVPWGFLLAVWNIFGTSVFFQERMYVMQHHGIKHSVCNMEHYTGGVGFWCLMYIGLKMVECTECVFIVLQKKDRLFRQLFHHTTILVYCWYMFSGNQVLCRWFGLMNYADHGIWYIYFPLRAAKIKMAKCITLFAIFTSIVEVSFELYIFRIVGDSIVIHRSDLIVEIYCVRN